MTRFDENKDSLISRDEFELWERDVVAEDETRPGATETSPEKSASPSANTGRPSVGRPILQLAEMESESCATGFSGLMAVVACLLMQAAPCKAADETPTTIAIPGMHCAGCAKKVTDELKVVAVVKAEADMATKTIKITAKSGKKLSPKDLWEAVEKSEQTPTKLEGPNGTFTAKPKS